MGRASAGFFWPQKFWRTMFQSKRWVTVGGTPLGPASRDSARHLLYMYLFLEAADKPCLTVIEYTVLYSEMYVMRCQVAPQRGMLSLNE
jgi:hypothetical protein